MFKKSHTQITVINNDEIHFVVFENNEWKVLYSISLDQFLTGNGDSELIPGALIRDKENSLLVVSDYWFGNVPYDFQSKKRALANAFVERRIQADNPDLPDVKYFFDYISVKTEENKQQLYTYFLQEPKFFQLYNQLAKSNFAPRQITSPAFLWEQKLKRDVSDFQKGGKGLVHLFQSKSILYFFSQGRHLFSRDITLPDHQGEFSEIFDVLTYEINQSIYLFSQKAKAEIDTFYLVSPNKEDARGLSNILGKEVKSLGTQDQRLQPSSKISQALGPVGGFNADDLAPSRGFLSISHKQLKAELEWKPIQTMGIAIGLVLLLLFGVEAFYLVQWYTPAHSNLRETGSIAEIQPKQIIQQYNAALDLLLADARHASPREIITNIAKSLPNNILINQIAIDIENPPGVNLKGVVTAAGADQFKRALSFLIANLNKHNKGPRPVLMRDIDFRLDENKVGQEKQDYLISFRFDLL